MKSKEDQNYSVEPGNWEDEPVIVLRDKLAGSVAMVAPSLGGNLFFWSIEHDGRNLQVVETPASPQVLRDRPTRAGVPVLWPFPGRVRNACYTYDGKKYQLPRNDKGGVNSIHAAVVYADWRVAGKGTSTEGAFVELEAGQENIPADFQAGFPFKFSLSIRFALQGQRLRFDVSLQNLETERAFPFGFGLHPYLRVPLVSSPSAPDRSACQVIIPATGHWPTEGGIPNGPVQPVPLLKDFSTPRLLGPDHFDDMYSNVSYKGEWTVASYRNPGTNLEVQVKADRNFQNWVLFTPPGRPSLAIEPYTCPPNAVNFAEQGIPGANLLELKAGKSWQCRVELEVITI